MNFLVSQLEKNFPRQLLEQPIWALHRAAHNDKSPRMPNRESADVSDRNTWSTFSAARDAYQKGGFDGLGMMVEEGTIVGVDLDHVLDKETREYLPGCAWAAQLVKDLDSYAEKSWNDGIHILCVAGFHAPPSARTKKMDGGSSLAVYPRSRFLVVTGDAVTGPELRLYAPEPINKLIGDSPATEAHALPLKPSVDVRTELAKKGFRYEEREGGLGTYLDYHGLNGQKCLTAGRVHENNKRHVQMCSVVLTKDNKILHVCFHSDCCGDPQGNYTRRALKALGLDCILADGKTVSLSFQWGDETTEEQTEWLVEDFIPLTEPTGFTGESDTRKSTLALTIAAAGSCGAKWFNGAENRNAPFSTIYIGTEDSWASVSLPRFLAAGGDRGRIARLANVKLHSFTKDGKPHELETEFSLDEYLGHLGQAIKEMNSNGRGPVKLLIFDPLISVFGKRNYNDQNDASEMMYRIKKFQEEHRLAVLSNMHHNKVTGQSAKQRTSGSHRISDAHKMLWTFTLADNNKKITLITPTKKNLLEEAVGHKVATESVELELPNGTTASFGRIVYKGRTEKTTDEILEDRESPDHSKRKEAREVIVEFLRAKGAKPMGEIRHHVKNETDASSATITRALKDLKSEGEIVKQPTDGRVKASDAVWDLAERLGF